VGTTLQYVEILRARKEGTWQVGVVLLVKVPALSWKRACLCSTV
jgi:hypothetical protein